MKRLVESEIGRGGFVLAALIISAFGVCSNPSAATAGGAPPIPPYIIVGTDTGASQVVAYKTSDGTVLQNFVAYPSTFGARVAVGDVNGDGYPDIITASGAGGGPHVKVFDGLTLQLARSFFAYDAGFTGGVYVASGDLDGDGLAEIIVGAGPGSARPIKAFSGSTGLEIRSFFAEGAGATGGVRVASGDVNGDGRLDLVTATASGVNQPHVRVFDGLTSGSLPLPVGDFLPYGSGFAGGVFVAAGDVNGDGFADIAVGPDNGTAAHVKVFSGKNLDLLHSFFPYAETFPGGVRVSLADLDGNGLADLITGSEAAGASGHVKVFDGRTGDLSVSPLANFLPFSGSPGGIFVASVPPPPALITRGRSVADFDDSSCTDLTDFLFILDNWQMLVNGIILDIDDFLALLDNWQLGEACL